MRLIRERAKTLKAAEERNRKACAFAIVARSSSKIICAYQLLKCNSSKKRIEKTRTIREPDDQKYSRDVVACCFASSVLHRDRPYYNRMIFGLVQLCGWYDVLIAASRKQCSSIRHERIDITGNISYLQWCDISSGFRKSLHRRESPFPA